MEKKGFGDLNAWCRNHTRLCIIQDARGSERWNHLCALPRWAKGPAGECHANLPNVAREG
eukprot:2982945-Amphidinium_carterae.1